MFFFQDSIYKTNMPESDKTDLKIIGLYEENGNLPEEQKIHLKRDIGLISAINLILNLIIGECAS